VRGVAGGAGGAGKGVGGGGLERACEAGIASRTKTHTAYALVYGATVCTAGQCRTDQGEARGGAGGKEF
jgi:hypothetical protein